MAKKVTHIISILVTGIVLLRLTVVSASAQPITVDQCDTMEFSVVSRSGIPEAHYVWAIYNSSTDPTDVLDPAGAIDPAIHFVNGQYAGSTVQVLGVQPGLYYVRVQVWDEVTCTDNVEMYVMEVVENLPEVTLEGDSMCVDEQPPSVRVIFTGTAPYSISYSYDDGNTVVNMNGIVDDEIYIEIPETLPVGETTFWVMEVGDNCTVNTYEVVDRPRTGILIYPMPVKQPIYLKED